MERDRLGTLTTLRCTLAAACLCLAVAAPLPGQVPTPVVRPYIEPVSPELRGRRIESVRVVGNTRVPTAVILNVIRTREGERFDPATTQEDIDRVYALKKFSNVVPRVEATPTGVAVVFLVTEQKQIAAIRYLGNRHVDELDIKNVVDLKVGQAIDTFRISLARQGIERLYRDRNYPFAHVELDDDAVSERGDLLFLITEGPHVRVRRVAFKGNYSFSDDKLRDQVGTKSWVWIFRPGTFNPDAMEDDVAALHRFYEGKGFFDARVGRKLDFSPDQEEMQVTFLIEEGVRYVVDHVIIKGVTKIPESELRGRLKLVEGRPFDTETLQRDVREVVRAYSPFGFIYQPQSVNPDYLRIGTPAEPVKYVFGRTPGKVDLVYDIHEGKSFRLGRIITKGNYKTQDKVILRQMRMSPGQLYNSGEVQDAAQRLRAQGPLFSGVNVTPVGEAPDVRDLLVEVVEGRTASFNIGAGVNSNGGIGGNISYQQENFDIANMPTSWQDIFTGKAFTGAGQQFLISLEPGTIATNATVRFTEPWLFDQPYSLTTEAYLRDRIREHYDERRLGGRISFGKRFDYVWSGLVTLRGEDVNIHAIDDPQFRAPEIVNFEGHSTLTLAGLQLRRNTTNAGFFPYEGTNTIAGYEYAGAFGGDFAFHRLSLAWNGYQTLATDLLDRRTVLALRAEGGYIIGDAPFFERYYGGGIGSVRGFRFRGVSPRSGVDDDPIGGDFALSGTAELSFPLAGDTLRGVVFADAGDVERDFHLGTIRASVGTGVRLVLPFLGGAPFALDFAVPLNKNRDDDVQYISFSFGVGY